MMLCCTGSEGAPKSIGSSVGQDHCAWGRQDGWRAVWPCHGLVMGATFTGRAECDGCTPIWCAGAPAVVRAGLNMGVHAALHKDGPAAPCLQGIVMPPRVAPTQVVVIPILNSKMSDADKQGMLQQAEDIVSSLKKAGVRVQSDSRENYTPGWKYNHWELKVSCCYRWRRCFTGARVTSHETLPHIPAQGKVMWENPLPCLPLLEQDRQVNLRPPSIASLPLLEQDRQVNLRPPSIANLPPW